MADEAARQAQVVRYGHGIGDTPACYLWGEGTHVPDIVRRFGPFDAVVCQHPRHCAEYTGFEDVAAPTVAIMQDYFPRNYDMKHRFLSRGMFDLAFFPESYMVDASRSFQTKGHIPLGTKIDWLPFAVDMSVFQPYGLTKRYDVMAVYSSNHNGGYPNRETVARLVRGLNGRHVVTRVAHNNKQKIVHEDYVRLLAQSKIAVASNDRWGSMNLKHLEIMASGALLLTDTPLDFPVLGFIAGEHYVEYHEPEEIPALCEYYLDHDAKRAQIVRDSMYFVCRQDSMRIRVKQMLDKIRELV